MRSLMLLLIAILLAPLAAAGQDIDTRYVASLYSDRYCNRISGNGVNRAVNSTNFGPFWEKELANSLYKKVLVVPAGQVEEGKAKKYSKACKSPWYFVDPARSRQMTYRPSEVDEALQEQCLSNPEHAYFEAPEPFRICAGEADTFQRQFYALHFAFSINAPDRQVLDGVRDGKVPLRLTIVHLKETRIGEHEVYIHLTGTLAP